MALFVIGIVAGVALGRVFLLWRTHRAEIARDRAWDERHRPPAP